MSEPFEFISDDEWREINKETGLCTLVRTRIEELLRSKSDMGWVRINDGDYPDELDRYERDEIHNGEMVFFLREIEEEKVKCDHMEIHGFTISGDGVETQKSKATSNFCKDCGEKLK